MRRLVTAKASCGATPHQLKSIPRIISFLPPPASPAPCLDRRTVNAQHRAGSALLSEQHQVMSYTRVRGNRRRQGQADRPLLGLMKRAKWRNCSSHRDVVQLAPGFPRAKHWIDPYHPPTSQQVAVIPA